MGRRWHYVVAHCGTACGWQAVGMGVGVGVLSGLMGSQGTMVVVVVV